MATGRTSTFLSWLLFTFVVILMASLLPLIQAIRPGFQREKVYITREENSQVEMEVKNSSNMFPTRNEKGISSAAAILESERKVPTGPDPLHHNLNPIGP